MSSTWWPKAPRLRLVGLRLAAGLQQGEQATVVSTPKLVQDSLVGYRGNVYKSTPVDEDKMHKMLQIFQRRNLSKLKFQSLSVPNKDQISDAIRFARHSATGRDGIPYAAWKADVETSAATLQPVGVKLSSSPPPPTSTTKTLCFPPKGLRRKTSPIPPEPQIS